ncbi:MAG: outer membrane protein assembly factor BamA [Nitrospinota bacterium]
MENAVKAGVCASVSAFCLAFATSGVMAKGRQLIAQAPSPRMSIRTVQIRGNKQVDSSTVRFYLQIKEGKSYTNIELIEGIRKDVRTIYGLGFFRDVKAEVESFEGGFIVTYRVKEKPTIRKVEFQGNVTVDENDIREKITVKVQTFVNEATIKETVRNIRKLYQEKGHYFARVEAVLKEGSRNTVDLMLRINEGESVEIETITFRGIEAISRKDILAAMATDEAGFFSWLTESGIFKEDELARDLLRIRHLYQSRGYFKVQVGQPIIQKDRERSKLNIIIPISEGFEYKVGEIEIRGGEDVIPPEELRSEFKLFTGDTFNRSLMFVDVGAIKDAFAARGYAFADVLPSTSADDEKKVVKFLYEIKKGRRVYIGRVTISGNTRTRENVIRREVRVTEGALYDSKGITKTRRLLTRTGYFKTVKVDEKRRAGSNNILDINIKVDEQRTGAIGAGVGFNNQEGATFTASIRENNLFGRGYRALFAGSISSEVQRLTASFTDPNFQDRDFSIGADIFIVDEVFSTFENERKGGRINLGKSLTDDLTAFLSYELSVSTVSNVSSVARQDIIDLEGEDLFQSQMTSSLVYDSRNRRFLPDTGTLATLSPSISGGFLGGDVDVAFIRADFRQYHNIGEKFRLRLLKKLVFSYRAEGRYIDSFKGSLPAFRRLFLSGRRAVRGFSRDNLGPVDRGGEAIGGFSTGLFSIQLAYPLFGPTRLVTFLDAGNVWERSDAFDVSDLRWGAGFGLRVVLPIGPLRIDLGYKLDKKTGERDREVHFGLGTSF